MLTVHHLNCAHFMATKLDGTPLGCHVLLVETEGGLVLVDTALGLDDYAAISRRLGRAFGAVLRPVVDGTLAASNQIRSLGFDPKDVRDIVLTHLDLDHVGGLSDFPWATVHVHEDELNAALVRAGFLGRMRYRPPMWAHGPHWSIFHGDDEKWKGLPTTTLAGLPDEIRAVSLPGHTRGHCGVLVGGAEGWMLHAGDAYFDPREVSRRRRVCSPSIRVFEAIVTTDRHDRNRSQALLRAFVRDHPEVTVFCAHAPFPGYDSPTPEISRRSSRGANAGRAAKS